MTRTRSARGAEVGAVRVAHHADPVPAAGVDDERVPGDETAELGDELAHVGDRRPRPVGGGLDVEHRQHAAEVADRRHVVAGLRGAVAGAKEGVGAEGEPGRLHPGCVVAVPADVAVAGALGGLDDGERVAGGAHGRPHDGALVARAIRSGEHGDGPPVRGCGGRWGRASRRGAASRSRSRGQRRPWRAPGRRGHRRRPPSRRPRTGG